MSYLFNADEVFEMACEMERNGAAFYQEMSEKITEKSAKELLSGFSKMEKAHEAVFKSMKEKLSDQDRVQTVFDPENETVQYLKAMVDLAVFDKKAEEKFSLQDDLSDTGKIKKVLRFAIGMEWQTISYYLGLKKMVPKNLGKSKIDDILKEEMRHVKILSDRLTSA